jgi:hypothetical protein
MSRGSPFSGSISVGTADKGARSDAAEKVRRVDARTAAIPGGEEDIIWVEEVGTGVGYVDTAGSRATRFCGLGREGDELKGSKAGSRDAGRLTPAAGASELLEGDKSMIVEGFQIHTGSLFFKRGLESSSRDSRHRVFPKENKKERGDV